MIIDLTHTLTANMPVHEYDESPSLEQMRSLTEDFYNDWRLTSGMHVGTHIDGPGHLTISALKMSEVPVLRFVGKGYLVDARGKKEINETALDELPDEKGLIVLFYTGSATRFGQPEYFSDHPVLTPSCAQKLVEHDVSMIGIDFFSPDAYPFNIHKLLFNAGIFIAENLTNLEQLRGIQSFTVVALPLKTETDSALARVVAISE